MAKNETDSEMLDRVRSMASGSQTWDLSDRDIAALKHVLATIDKLAAFKAYVHKRLDDAGVPVDPESSHKAEGCRIGGRLDIVLAGYAANTPTELPHVER